MASFSTTSLVRESPEVILRYARYYASVGVDDILLFWDGDDTPTLPPVAGLSLTACDAEFWAGLGGRPEGLEARQAAVYGVAMQRCRSDWLLICDADEYVFGDPHLGDWLDRIPGHADAVRIPVAEAVWGPGDDPGTAFGSTWFRTAWPRERLWRLLGRSVYGDVAPLMRRGLLGHVEGKQVVRTGRTYSAISNMGAEQDGRPVGRPASAISANLAGLWLGHFDAISLGRWQEKWERRISRETLAERMSAPRQAQMDLVARRLEQDRGEELFRSLYGLSRPQSLALRSMGVAFRRELAWGNG